MTLPNHSPPTAIEATDRETAIRNAAYFRWAYRCCTPGHELDDWLAAEREVDSVLDRRSVMVRQAAHSRWADRGYIPGHELDDWLEAEREVDSLPDTDADGRLHSYVFRTEPRVGQTA